MYGGKNMFGEVMSTAAAQVGGLKLLGGRLCLDFANTVDPRHGDHRREYLGGYRDLVEWVRHAGVIGENEGRRLLKEAGRRPAEAAAAFERAVMLRETTYIVFHAVAYDERPNPRDVEAIGQAHVGAMNHSRLASTREGFEWVWAEDGVALERPIWPVALSATELLTSGDLGRVKECPGSDGCGWLFFDSSKNGRRRWCSMEGCGSRDKMRRLYARKRTGGSGSGG
jgi:predicted RNA-binding Zn ribbon-like protein